jgi:photosystem II stability/assembly factor-like uncharacterized protein
MKQLLLFLSLIYTTSVSAQWEWQNPLPQGNNLNAIHFVDTLEGWAAGDFGTVLHTTDRGLNWAILNIGTTEYFNDLTFIGKDTGWIVGYGMIYHTINGGESWIEQDMPGPLNCESVFFINVNDGWVVGSNYNIFHTQNGGESWEEQESGMGSAYGWLYSVFFINEDIGWTCGHNGVILKTEDGGNSWMQVNTGTNQGYSSIFFIDYEVGWATCYDGIFKSTDGGDSWALINSDVHGYSLFFSDILNGWISCQNGKVYKTADGGISWELVPCEASGDLWDLQFVNCTIGFIVGGSQILSYNSELNYWESLTIGFNSTARDLFFLNENEGWVAGSGLHHTLDGGITWQEQTPAQNASYASVHFEDSMNGWITGYRDVYHTKDGGENWELQLRLERGYDTTFRQIFFTDTLHGWVLDFFGLLFYTRDGGKIWEEQYTGLTVQQNAICAIDSLTAWIAGGYGWVSKTIDGGENWTAFNDGFQFSMNWDIQFIDAQHGWMVDDGVFYTEDGGQSWARISNSGGYAFHFIDLNQGWLLTGNGIILHTQDGGYTWEGQNRLTNVSLEDVWFTDENNGWAAGGFGMILHTDNGGTVGIPDSKFQISSFKAACFPNPLSSITTIQYELPKDAFVSLAIFNSTGQRIDNLVNSRQLRGKHEVRWNAENLPSGIYFYRISTYNQSTTGKLVIIR